MPSDISDWNPIDPFAAQELVEIQPLSKRAFSLLLRNKHKPILETEFLRVAGVIEIMEGLEYHSSRFNDIKFRYGHGQRDDLEDINHEVVAYFNRVGQFHTFARSAFVKTHVTNPLSIVPRICQLLVFRNKHAAHRSIDAPREGDTVEVQNTHAISLNRYFGRIYSPIPGAANPPLPDSEQGLVPWRRALCLSAYIVFQIYNPSVEDTIFFTIETDHPVVMEEAYALLEALLS
ncbi:MAG TPA: hypothetical protein VET25_03290 [Aestuariivirgaceae bacterium]|nr:hypothetical protein [Aestuariivirgaceae bacterium]